MHDCHSTEMRDLSGTSVAVVFLKNSNNNNNNLFKLDDQKSIKSGINTLKIPNLHTNKF